MLLIGTISSRVRLALCALLFVLFASWLHAEQVYVVKRGDTLFGISRRHGTTVAELAERNGLSRSAHIYVGQRLTIPASSSGSSRPNASVQAAIDSASSISRRWKYIVIHHSGVDTGTVKGMDRYHREERHMENGLAYHFVVGNGSGMRDGEIAAGRRWRAQLDGGHLASEAQNKVSIGICLVGNFEKHKPTAAQMRSLEALVESLLGRCKLSPAAVKTHRGINVVKTRCPGRYFPEESFLKNLEAAR